MGGVGVPERVRRAVRRRRRRASGARASCARPTARAGGRARSAAAPSMAPATRGARRAQPFVERLARGLADGHDALAVALADARAGARRRRRTTRASSPQTSLARRPQPYSSSRIARSRRLRTSSFQSPSSSGAQSAARDRVGQAAAPARADEHERGVVRALAAAHEIAEQRARRREPAGDRGGREPARRELRLPAAQRLAAAGLRRQPLLREERAQLAEIAAQRAHRVRRVAVGDTRREEALDRRARRGWLRRLSSQRERPSATMPAPL